MNERLQFFSHVCNQVRRQLDGFMITSSAQGVRGADASGRVMAHPMGAALRHGIYRERIAEMATDSMRALLLEIAGYDVKVFEFIGGEHTAKNVIVAASKRSRQRSEV